MEVGGDLRDELVRGEAGRGGQLRLVADPLFDPSHGLERTPEEGLGPREVDERLVHRYGLDERREVGQDAHDLHGDCPVLGHVHGEESGVRAEPGRLRQLQLLGVHTARRGDPDHAHAGRVELPLVAAGRVEGRELVGHEHVVVAAGRDARPLAGRSETRVSGKGPRARLSERDRGAHAPGASENHARARPISEATPASAAMTNAMCSSRSTQSSAAPR